MSRMDAWPWGYCAKCNRMVITYETGGVTRLKPHNVNTTYKTSCTGSNGPPMTPPEEETPDGEEKRTHEGTAQGKD